MRSLPSKLPESRFFFSLAPFYSLRLSADACLQHKWLAQAKQTMKSVKLPTDRLKKFIIRRKWQVTRSAVVVFFVLHSISFYWARECKFLCSSAPIAPSARLSTIGQFF